MTEIEKKFYQDLVERNQLAQIHFRNGDWAEGRIKEFDDKVVVLTLESSGSRKVSIIYINDISHIDSRY